MEIMPPDPPSWTTKLHGILAVLDYVLEIMACVYPHEITFAMPWGKIK
jgi:hypothetical protein